MAAGLIDIKRRIKSVTNTRKITKAMGLVATSKLRKIRLALSVNNKYFESVEKVTNEFLASLDVENDNIYFNNNNSKKKLYIVMASDSGLCGGYNANVVQKLKAEADKMEVKPVIMVVGQRGIPYVRKYHFETIAEYVQISDMPTVKESRIIFEHALRLYKEGEVGEVNIVYTEFMSQVKQEVKTKKFLPLEQGDKKSQGEYLIEPAGSEVVENVLDVYLKAVVQNIMLHSKCSEYSSRMSAMDGASKNANDLLDALNTKFNRIRQTAITQEITEIVSGAQAQN
ncbi:ATP synthase F1 subunit gamma [Inconstantimicrobium mannanitabidum]|uniref:ATP synthase gamma chain n=1 Tax=Inconstantimicrobium mannanitabidum TaxID=1604901 RepID=A0ACB5R7H2_9CLOT|nr:ATP synthase F1 subunit gamma [Clostridium sp. TW13]GKX64946.1 ATP synthase gamma chain [Clostridium sp. TW13]